MNKILNLRISSVTLLVYLLVSLISPQTLGSPEEKESFPLYPLQLKSNFLKENGERGADIPVRINIPSLSINLAIKPTSASDNNWDFFSDAVSYWIESAKPGEEGNIVLYVHRNSHFGPLYNSKIGETIIVYTNSARYSYTISEFKVASPNQIEVFTSTDAEQLTLLTCTNAGDADRLVLIAKPAISFGELLN